MPPPDAAAAQRCRLPRSAVPHRPRWARQRAGLRPEPLPGRRSQRAGDAWLGDGWLGSWWVLPVQRLRSARVRAGEGTPEGVDARTGADRGRWTWSLPGRSQGSSGPAAFPPLARCPASTQDPAAGVGRPEEELPTVSVRHAVASSHGVPGRDRDLGPFLGADLVGKVAQKVADHGDPQQPDETSVKGGQDVLRTSTRTARRHDNTDELTAQVTGLPY